MRKNTIVGLALAVVLSLSLAVDSNVSTFTDPQNSAWSVQDKTAGNVYVALGTSIPVNATTMSGSISEIRFSIAMRSCVDHHPGVANVNTS